LKTIAYIDGFNLYYSLLRGSPYKWLDVVKLLEDILRTQNPSYELIRVKFFTAPVLARYARHGQSSHEAQSAYWRGVEAIHGGRFEVIVGKHSPEKVWLPVVAEGQPLDRANRQQVWNLNEKQTDVNLALQMFKDTKSGTVEQVVLVTNDSDFEPLVREIQQSTAVQIGLVSPLPHPSVDRHRRPSASLVQFANWTRRYILESELAAAQLPLTIPTRRKPIKKPLHWYQ
jgi:uncharacterized LabA/DUF88 family protein